MTVGHDTWIVGGDLITGGRILRRHDLHLVDGRIAEVVPGRTRAKAPLAHAKTRTTTLTDVEGRGARRPATIDATGRWVLPGLVNGHTHGCTTGPLFSSAAVPLTAAEARQNADRHLSHGVTTLVNACGWALPEDVIDHPIDIRLATTHFPRALAAAEIVDGAGLTPRNRRMSAEEMLDRGAIAIGEVGSGATLGGGVAAYRYVPDAVRRELGLDLQPDTVMQLMDALVGASRTRPPDRSALLAKMESLGLPRDAGPVVAAAIIRYAVEPVTESLGSLQEAAALSTKTGAPAIFHTAAPSVAAILQLAGTTPARVIAGHMNHTSMTPESAVAHARRLREAGATLDVSSLDIVDRRELALPDVADALMRARLVDTLSTDYAGGHWEAMLALVQRWVEMDLVEMAEGVSMCTDRPARVLGLTDRGVLAEGLRADVVITSGTDLSEVEQVLIGGEVVYPLRA